MNNQPAPSRFWRWFDPRRRSPGTWAFILNRVTALGLTFYLALHLLMLSQLAQGPAAYNNFIQLAKTPVIKVGEILVIFGVHTVLTCKPSITFNQIEVRRTVLIISYKT